MPNLKITAAKGADNQTTFSIFDVNGDPVDLDSLGATSVTVHACWIMSSSTIVADSFESNSVTVRFGLLDLPVGKTYKPRIAYINEDNPSGVVIAGEGFETSITLKFIC